MTGAIVLSSGAGFYKRGCQEKTLLPPLQARNVSDIQPLRVAMTGGEPQFLTGFHFRATTSFAS